VTAQVVEDRQQHDQVQFQGQLWAEPRSNVGGHLEEQPDRTREFSETDERHQSAFQVHRPFFSDIALYFS